MCFAVVDQDMNLGELLRQGGWAMWPLYLCSFIALIVFFQRWLLFREIQTRELSWLKGVLALVKQHRFDAAIAECENHRHPIAHVLSQTGQVGIQRSDRLEAEAERVGNLEIQRYESFLPLLSFIAQVAPLLGLLGTVLGMVKMFLGLQNSGLANVNASALASGIWQALLTTAAGLIVAAPTLAAHLYLTSRVDRFRMQLSDAVQQFMTAWPMVSATSFEIEPVSSISKVRSTRKSADDKELVQSVVQQRIVDAEGELSVPLKNSVQPRKQVPQEELDV